MELEREYLRGARRKARAAKDYFDDDEDVMTDYSDTHSSALAQQNNGAGDEDEVDPLDAFMMGIETQVVQERQQVQKKSFEKVSVVVAVCVGICCCVVNKADGVMCGYVMMMRVRCAAGRIEPRRRRGRVSGRVRQGAHPIRAGVK